MAARKIALLGGGNLAQALARGWATRGVASPEDLHLSRRRTEFLAEFATRGFSVGSDNVAAVQACEVVVLAVQPQQLGGLLEEIRNEIDASRHCVISVVSGVEIQALRRALGSEVPIVRAMPNTAVAIGESMTCLAAETETYPALDTARELFSAVGETIVLPEEMMLAATALCACGIAFFLRAVRAASQGGIEIGFHPSEAIQLAAQTARGAASLILEEGGPHPESAIDHVTTPRGCTIAGLNEMEHQGFSSAMIKGILVSARKAGALYEDS